MTAPATKADAGGIPRPDVAQEFAAGIVREPERLLLVAYHLDRDDRTEGLAAHNFHLVVEDSVAALQQGTYSFGMVESTEPLAEKHAAGITYQSVSFTATAAAEGRIDFQRPARISRIDGGGRPVLPPPITFVHSA